jgi:hypothetical protein
VFALYHVPVIVRSHTPSRDVAIVLLLHFGFGVFMCRVRAETETLWFPTGMHTLSNVVVIAFWVDPSEQVLTPFGVLDAMVVAMGLVMAFGLALRRFRPRPEGAPTPAEMLKFVIGSHVRSNAGVHGRAAAELRRPGERGLFARFTQPSRRAVVRAQEEGRIRGDDAITTEHLLVGVIAEADDTAVRALVALGVPRERYPGLGVLANDAWAPPDPPIPFTPRAKAVLERALLAAIELGHPTIEPSHLLLGLVRQDRGDDGALLRELAIDRDRAEATVLHALALRDEAAAGDRLVPDDEPGNGRAGASSPS